jgi:sugar transferase (PEP-CTERM system associated)
VAHIRLFNHYIQGPYLLLALLELGVLFGAAYGAMYLRYGDEFAMQLYLGSDPVYRAVVFALVMSLTTWAMGVYGSRLREGFAGMAVRSVVSFCLLGSASLSLLYYLVPQISMGRGVLFWAVVLSLAGVLLLRYLFFKLVDVQRLRRRVVFYGAGRRTAELLEQLQGAERGMSVEIVGCIPAGDNDPCLAAAPILQAPDDWLQFVRTQRISEIVISMDERRRGEGAVFPLAKFLDCKLAGVRVCDAIGFYERETGKIELSLVQPGWMLFSEGFRYSQGRDIAKRAFDIVVSLALLAVVWPLMLIAAVMIALESGFPIIYRQTRTGLNGKPFQVLKFRSMRKDAEKDGKAVWAKKNDDRITRFGHFMRNTRIDELPQLYNVLKGDMSFIGPRPERPEFVCDLVEKIPYYDTRHRVKPGLMGWAQLKYPYGASVDDAAQKLRYDLYYVKNHSLLLDIVILVQTVEVILLGKGVH